jgi:hypothetical protein
VYWTEGFSGLFSDAGPVEQRHGVLTTEHAASSYGLPVVVGEDGQVYGPAEVPEINDLHCELSDEAAELIAAARSAGYRVASAVTPA